jgi:hypothetical protein
MVMNRGLLLISVGLVIGMATALAVSRLVQTLLFDVRANDPVTFVSAAFSPQAALLPSYLLAELHRLIR